MARVLVTGSTTGLGLAAARTLLDAGHGVIVHARNDERAEALGPLVHDLRRVVIADLTDLEATRSDGRVGQRARGASTPSSTTPASTSTPSATLTATATRGCSP